MRVAPVLALGILVAAFSLAAATHSTSPCESKVTPIGVLELMFYHVEDADGSVWIYQEVNGHPGLQRGGSVWWMIGNGGGPAGDNSDGCWDVDIATGEQIWPTDRVVF